VGVELAVWELRLTETRVIVACAEHKVHWYLGAEPAKCTDPGHQHRQFEAHRHRDAVTLPDGTQVTAVSFDAVDPYSRDRQPDYGLYLDHRWRPPWAHDHLDWTDFGVPADPAMVVTALRSLLDRARAGEQVEIGCLGGHGRTGTALACLAVLADFPAGDAVAWVRAKYCPKAVETAAQEAFIAGLPC
jgi:protein-tyrosine phosphatase